MTVPGAAEDTCQWFRRVKVELPLAERVATRHYVQLLETIPNVERRLSGRPLVLKPEQIISPETSKQTVAALPLGLTTCDTTSST